MTSEIKHELFFPHSPELVWDYLTEPALLAQWLMPNDFQPVVGADFQFRIDAKPALRFDGIVYCKVLEYDPYKKLSYSWRAGPGDAVIELDSLVVWTLHPKEDGTLLKLHHTGFKEINIALFTGMNAGWLSNMKKIQNFLNTAVHGTGKL